MKILSYSCIIQAYFLNNKGSDGGAPIRALNYVKRNSIPTQSAYPYIAEQNKNCQIKGDVYHISVTVSIFANEEAHQAALQEGPISVAVQASDWKNYKPKGDDYIFPSSACNGDINHAVLAVRFTSEAQINKNSSASTWGVDGYIYLQMELIYVVFGIILLFLNDKLLLILTILMGVRNIINV